MKQNAPWSQWMKREAIRFYWSFRRQYNLWRLGRLHDHRSEEFKARFRANINLNRKELK